MRGNTFSRIPATKPATSAARVAACTSREGARPRSGSGRPSLGRDAVGGRSALLQARALWRDGVAQPLPADQFRIAHLAALRATAALLSARRDPEERIAHRPTSAWVLILKIAPEFSDWASYFAAGVAKRAAADAGVVRVVDPAEATEMIEAVRTYLFLVEAVLTARERAAAGLEEAREGRFDSELGTAGLAVDVTPAAFPPPASRMLAQRAS